MRDLGEISIFLGMQITRDRANRTLTVRSTKHINDMLERFGMADAKPSPTPLPHKCALRAYAEGDDLLPANVPYRALIGSLLYVSTWTRPDIAFAVSQVARFQSQPTVAHWYAAKCILRYLHGTRDLGLTYSASEGALPRGYVDASWGEDPDTRRSQSGYALTIGNGAVSWISKLQTTIALSSTEAEYTSLACAVKGALGLRNLLSVLWPEVSKSFVLFEDNQSTIKQALKLQSSERTKHIDLKHHFLKDHVAKGEIIIKYIPTAEQPADCLTKCLDRIKVSLFRQSLGVL